MKNYVSAYYLNGELFAQYAEGNATHIILIAQTDPDFQLVKTQFNL